MNGQKLKKILKEWILSTLAQSEPIAQAVGRRIFSQRTGEEQPTPFLMLSGIAIEYGYCKDCSFPTSATAAVSVVAQDADTADNVATAVETILTDAYILPLSSFCRLLKSEDVFDYEQDLHGVALTFNIDM